MPAFAKNRSFSLCYNIFAHSTRQHHSKVFTECSQLGTHDCRIQFLRRISPWHDINLLFPGSKFSSNPTLQFVNEIPKGSYAKYEIRTQEPLNPIRQDTKKGALRYLRYQNQGIPFNYGSLPQTWEGCDATSLGPYTFEGLHGDGDPVDVVELSETPMAVGEIRKIRIIGSIGLIDENEMDWKVIARAIPCDTEASDILRTVSRDELEAIKSWFINYKTIDGKPKNALIREGKFYDSNFTLQMITHSNKLYCDLCEHKISNTKGLWLPSHDY
mmetsp:Transcript_20180/g.27840  ORF Transcript_20180/g.27840 Transcript_20180/m.27840 type:complete len:272 (+) Transcript_20180:48-863(+)